MSASPKEIRKARAFLNSRGIRTRMIHPKKFAGAAKQMKMTFYELLAVVMRMYSQGQNQQFYRQQDISTAAKNERR